PKVCIFCKDRTDWVDYKDVNLLRRFMSDRGKIRARRVTGNCAQHQRDVAVAIKTARELALLPYTQRTMSERGPGRGGGRGGGGGGGGGGGRPGRFDAERPPREDQTADAVAPEPDVDVDIADVALDGEDAAQAVQAEDAG
ncbi:MAG: small subunit ribosomal protein, partial [Actinomycetota bacterium]